MLFMLFLGLLVAAINAGVVYRFWKREMAWWEYLVPIAINVTICLLAKFAAETSLTNDYEFWGGWGTVACYQEPWTEWYEVDVDDYCTRTVSDGKKGTKTERYKCGSHKETRYTSHPERWWLENSNGETIYTDPSDYGWLAHTMWRNEHREDGHHGDYHRVRFGFQYSGEGYLHKTRWPGTDETFVPTTTQHTYTNKVQAADQSLFHFEAVDKEDIKDFGLHELPSIERYYRMNYVSGDNTPEADRASRKLEEWNAKIGREKQVQMRVLVFVDKPFEAAQSQEAHWMGGNKNEFIVCVGVDSKTRAVLWAYVISWTEQEMLKIRVRDFARSMKQFDPVKLVDYMVPEVRKDFIRKPFAEFSYLKVATPIWAYWVAFFLSIMATAAFDTWAIKNEYDSNS